MEAQGLLPSPAKPQRRRHSPQFKTQVVSASFEPDRSVAGVAQQFNINANLVHKWRRQFGRDKASEANAFVQLPVPQSVSTVTTEQTDTTIKIDVPSAVGAVTLHWPISQPQGLAQWLKALQA